MNIRPLASLPIAPPRPAASPAPEPGPLDAYLQAVEPAYLLASLGKK